MHSLLLILSRYKIPRLDKLGEYISWRLRSWPRASLSPKTLKPLVSDCTAEAGHLAPCGGVWTLPTRWMTLWVVLHRVALGHTSHRCRPARSIIKAAVSPHANFDPRHVGAHGRHERLRTGTMLSYMLSMVVHSVLSTVIGLPGVESPYTERHAQKNARGHAPRSLSSP